MSAQYLIKFDPITGERIDTLVYDNTLDTQAEQMLADGFEIVSNADFNKLIGNFDGQKYIKDVNTGEYIPEPSYEPSLQELKKQKLEIISNWTEQHIIGGFVYNDVTYDSDVHTQITMQGIALNVHTEQFAIEYPEGCPVRGYDAGSSNKTIHMLSADEVLGFCAAMSLHIGQCKQRGWFLQNKVHTATTKKELDNITWAE